MRKLLIAIIVSAILSATAAVPAFAERWGGHDGRDEGLPGGPLWPIVAAMSIPAAAINTVMHIAFPFQGIGYPATTVTARTGEYTGPADFSPAATAGPADNAPTPYYTPRAYDEPRSYYEPRGHCRERRYRTYEDGW